MSIFSVLLRHSFSSLDGVEFSADEKTLIMAPENLINYKVPAICEIIMGGTSQLDSSFFQCIHNIRKIDFEKGSQLFCIYPYVFKESSLESINMTYCTNLKYVNYSVFYGCNNLVTAILPEGMTSLMPGSFAESKSLQSIKIPDSVTTLPGWEDPHESVFTGCTLLKDVIISPTSNLEAIAADVFLGTSLSYIYIPSKANNIGNAFFGSKVENIEISSENQNYKFEFGALLSKNGETLYYFKYNEGVEFTVPASVKYIENGAFRLNNIIKIKFQSEIKWYSNYAFAGTKLTNFVLPSGSTEIPYRFLSDSILLETVELTNTIRFIKEGAFLNCKKLRSITLSNTLESIEANVFYGDSLLEVFECPPTLESIGPGAFVLCNSLTFKPNQNTKFSIGNDKILYFEDRVALAYFGSAEEISLHETCTEVANYTFQYKQITKITFNTVTTLTINSYAFSDTKLVDVVLPSCVGKIGEFAFNHITTLNSVTIPAEAPLKNISENCFQNCEKLQSVTLPESLENIFSSAFIKCKLLNQINLANTQLKTIGFQAFKLSGITSIELPTTLNSIEEECFSDSKLQTVIINQCTLDIVKGKAFYNCYDLKDVTLSDSVTIIKRYSFASCTSIVEFHFPQNINVIEARAFDNCINFQKFYLKADCGLSTIEGRAFNGCNKLRDISIEEGDTKFFAKDGVLMNHEKTRLLIFLPAAKTTIFVVPATIQKIENYAFYSCTNLRTIVIPEGAINSIGYSCFEGCTSLSSMYIPPTLEDFGDRSFMNCPQLKCGSVMYFNDNKARAIEVGIPQIAFETECPSLTFPTCRIQNHQFFGLYLLSIFMLLN